MNITICIPTYNRPESLARVLEHLASFKSPPDEIIIGDNSGTGSAESVVEGFREKFKSITYLRRNSNVGYMRNLDSVARVGTLPYLYILSDDDFVYENALYVMKNVMEARSDIIAVNGGYEGTTLGVIGLDRDFSDAGAVIVGKGQYELLWNTIEICDNLPLLRRADFLRYSQFRDLTCGIAPLLFDLLGHGDFVHVNAPVIQHEQRADSISARIASQEITDMANGDLEVVSCKANLLGNDGNTVRGRVVRNVYFQGARALFSQKKFLAGWHSLVRSNAYQGLGIATKIWAEKNILPHVLCEKICQVAADTGCSVIESEDGMMNPVWINYLNMQFKALHERVPPEANGYRKLVLLSKLDEPIQSEGEVVIPLEDLMLQFALAGYKLNADTSSEMLRITSDNPAWAHMDESHEVQIIALMSPYA